jgi:hypothetical protein
VKEDGCGGSDGVTGKEIALCMDGGSGYKFRAIHKFFHNQSSKILPDF